MTKVRNVTKVPMNFRVEPEFRERVARHAESPQFDRNESLFVRYSTDLVMNLRDALGPRFELEIARLLETANAREGVAA